MTKNQKIIITSACISSLICIALVVVFFAQLKQSIMGAFTNNYFTDNELCKSDTAKQQHIDNTPNQQQWNNLYQLRDKVLNPAREALGQCIIINSAFRSKQLNQIVGGTRDSQHTLGQAADITTNSHKGNKHLFQILVQQNNYDQLIWEKDGQWIHVSYSPQKRGQILATNNYGYINIKDSWQSLII